MASLRSALRLVTSYGLVAGRGRFPHMARRNLASEAAGAKRQAMADQAHIGSIRDKVNEGLPPGMDAWHYTFYIVFFGTVVTFVTACSQLERGSADGHGHGEAEAEEEEE